MSESPSSFTTLHGLRARMLIKDRLSKQNVPSLDGVKKKLLKDPHNGPIKIGIVGAGMAGIYTAFILDRLAIPQLSYEILEGSDRTGGRAYTYRFSDKKHDFYEAGAMRFPNIKPMERFFRFCSMTETPLIPYYFEDGSQACPRLFNNIRQTKPVDWSVNPFHIQPVQPGPHTYVTQDPSQLLRARLQVFIDLLEYNPAEGLRVLLDLDNYSTGQYLMERCGMSRQEVEYLETFTGSTNLFYRAFTEEVLEMVDFTSDDWKCIEDGAQTLADKAIAKLKTKPLLQKKVTKIYPVPSRPQSKPQARPLLVDIAGEPEPWQYDAVVLTTSLGCAERMDLTQANLTWDLKQSIRRLGYAAATKVGIKFSRAWWMADCGITTGGFAVTDEPLRICVYPSYNLHDDPKEPAVLLCSYTWTQDADRMATMVSRRSPANEDELRELLLRGLARLHGKDYEEIRAMYITHHAWAWYQDPWTTGAYASFEPAQWADLYWSLSVPAAQGRLIFAGEVASTHHAWILGALESGYRAVAYILITFGLFSDLDRLKELFGSTDETVLDDQEGYAFRQVYQGVFGADGNREEQE
ncbi:hypothetical protein HFD88_008994 [Aspergillus terreus]|nr:hypothetical protein HFD88_008994 [Aspergillus terreus]